MLITEAKLRVEAQLEKYMRLFHSIDKGCKGMEKQGMIASKLARLFKIKKKIDDRLPKKTL